MRNKNISEIQRLYSEVENALDTAIRRGQEGAFVNLGLVEYLIGLILDRYDNRCSEVFYVEFRDRVETKIYQAGLQDQLSWILDKLYFVEGQDNEW